MFCRAWLRDRASPERLAPWAGVFRAPDEAHRELGRCGRCDGPHRSRADEGVAHATAGTRSGGAIDVDRQPRGSGGVAGKITDMDKTLRTYAELAVNVGLNLRAGQRLLIIGPVAIGGVSLEAAPLVRAITERAYEAGASLVEAVWGDETM